MSQEHINSKTYLDSTIISFAVCGLIVLIALWGLQNSTQFAHWFLIPVAICGILIGIDTINWFRGHLTIFDPVGIMGVLGFHVFFLAPILHVSWNSWLEPWYYYPPDWRPWLGGMAILNCLGLVIYRFCRNLLPKKKQNPSSQITWQINYKRFRCLVSFAMALSALLQIRVYQQFGGIMGYIDAVSDKQATTNQFDNMGFMFLFSESFPILAMMAFAVYAERNKRLQSWPILIAVLLIFLGLQMFFGGLRGSRSNTIWALFWAVGIIHFWLRSITKKDMAIGLIFLVLFMYIYGFFKAGGLDGIKTALEGQESRAALEKKSGRTWEGLLLGDMGRSDVHANMLYRLSLPNSDYQYAWGETYVAALSILVPKVIMPQKPFKHKWMQGTELLFGKGTYRFASTQNDPSGWSTSKVFGITGEAMLNFGPLAVPLAFIPLGLLVGWVQSCLLGWDASDSRLLLMPVLVNFCFVVLMSDLDNDIFFLIKNSGLPALIIFLSSQKKFLLNNLSNYSDIYSKGGDLENMSRNIIS